jgi:ACR3 family arsenite efflux pump ArsB
MTRAAQVKCLVLARELNAVVGVLVEVPVMLSVVWIVNRSRGWYEITSRPGG